MRKSRVILCTADLQGSNIERFFRCLLIVRRIQVELYSKEKAGLRLLKSTMIKNGYTADIAEKSCVFTKKQKDSEQVQRIFVTIHPDFVTFRMELIPSSKYHFIKNEEVFDSNDEMLWKNKAVQEYRTTEELQNILKMIAFSMEKAGFQFLDHAAKDADDLYATHEEDMDLYLHHAEYVENFKRQHHITCNEINVIFQKIKEALIILLNDGTSYMNGSVGLTVRLLKQSQEYVPVGGIYILQSRHEGFCDIEVQSEDVFSLVYREGSYRMEQYEMNEKGRPAVSFD